MDSAHMKGPVWCWDPIAPYTVFDIDKDHFRCFGYYDPAKVNHDCPSCRDRQDCLRLTETRADRSRQHHGNQECGLPSNIEANLDLIDGILIASSLEEAVAMIQSRVRAENNPAAQVSDGSTASYYELPEGACELQDLIAHRDMNAQMGEIFRACYRYGQVAHSPKERDIKKIIYYAQAELKRLEKLQLQPRPSNKMEEFTGAPREGD